MKGKINFIKKQLNKIMLIHNKCHNKTETALGFVFRDTVTFIRRILTVTEDPCYIISSTSKFFNACRHFTGRN